jgi:hypothetical protein
MDPNETLRKIRELLAAHRRQGYLGESDTADLVEHVEAMNGWLGKGGALPQAWQRAD